MKIIDKLIRNSKPFRELHSHVEGRVTQAIYDRSVEMSEKHAELDHKVEVSVSQHENEMSNLYIDRLEKLIDLTTRVHNTILAVKHNQEAQV